jgi:hypothetical protein
VPSAGQAFVGWSGGGCTGTGTCDVTVAAATTVIARFVPNRLTVLRTGDVVGTVGSAPAGIACGTRCEATFNAGTNVTLTAATGPAVRLVGWSGAGCSGSGMCVLTLSAPTIVTAEFVELHTLTVAKAGAGTGSVSSMPAGIGCDAPCSTAAAAFDEDTVVTLTAAAGPASVFDGWSGAGCSGTGTCTVTMSAARTVTATFSPTFVLTVVRAGMGMGVVQSSPGGIDCGTDCSEPYRSGTSVTLTATPIGGSTFVGWSGSGCSGTGACTVSVSAARTVTATFNGPPMFALNVTVTGTGTVSSSPSGITACAAAAGDCTESYVSGTMVTLTASRSATWTGCAAMTTTSCNVTMDMMRAVTATFP